MNAQPTPPAPGQARPAPGADMDAQAPAPVPDARQAEARHLAQVYGQLPVEPVSGKGAWLRCADGRQLLDLYGGHAVCALGYGHPKVLEALRLQAGELMFTSNVNALRVRARAADKLAEFAPDGLDCVFFANSGAEANENALRLACRMTGRRRVVALEHGFHGRSAAAAAVTWRATERWYGFPRTPFDAVFVPRGDAARAAAAIDNATAAVIIEPIQGIAGAYPLKTDFVRSLRAACDRHGALLIADEVQCGMGRSGKPFAIEYTDAVPDLLTTAKALGSGFPCSALLMKRDLGDQLRIGDMGSTFGGGPLACAVIEAVLDAIREEGLLDQVARREEEIRRSCVTGPVVAIRGRGMLLGLECRTTAREVRDGLLARSILAGTSSDPAWLRLMPPLNLGASEVEQLSEALRTLGEEGT